MDGPERIAVLPDSQDRSPEPHKSKPLYKEFDAALNEDGVPHPEICKVLDENRDAFSFDGTPGKVIDGTELKIETDDNKLSPEPARRVGPEKEKVICETVQKLLSWKVIEPSNSRVSYPILLVMQNGKWRFCIDYRRLNESTVGDTYPMQRMDRVFDALKGMMYFTVMDAVRGYHNIPIAKRDRWKTAFISAEGLFQFLTMPFGLKNAPAIFQRFIDALLGSLRWACALAYIDDIVVFTKTILHHAESLNTILKRVIKSGLKLSPEKCHFGYTSLSVLGRIVGRDGLRINTSRAQAILNMREPKNMKELYTAIGLFGSYRAFIHKFALIAAPLTSITVGNKFKKDGAKDGEWKTKPIAWGDEQRKAYAELKKIIASAPVLAYPDYSLRFYLYIDASKDGFALAIHQQFPKSNELSHVTFQDVNPTETISWERELKDDKLFGPILNNLNNHKNFMLKNRLLWIHRDEGDRVCVPKAKLKDVFHDCHDALGHPGFARSWSICQNQFFRPSLSVALKEYIVHCPGCLRTKVSRRPRPGEMPPQSIAPIAFHAVAMDFVTGLPRVNDYDCILLVVDLWTKAVILIPTTSKYSASSVAEDFFIHVVRRGFMPSKFVSDNDKVFIGAFWKHLTKKLNIKCVFTSPYHAQADPAERYNQTMEAMLRAYTLTHDKDWPNLLVYVEIAMNSLKSSTTDQSPFDLLYINRSGQSQIKRLLDNTSGEVDNVEDIDLLAAERLRDAQDALTKAHQNAKKYYDSNHSKLISFKVNDWALIRLSSRPIKMVQHQLTKPLIGPYRVKEAFQRSVILDLPDNLKIHPRFSVQHLEHCPAPGSDPYNRPLRHPPIEIIEGEDAFEVERIIGKRTFGRSKHIQYLVKWKNYPESESTWEFANNLIDDDCGQAIEDYEKTQSIDTGSHSTLTHCEVFSNKMNATKPKSTSPSLSRKFAYNQESYSERPVNFESRVTRSYESKYEALELELSCLTWAVLKSVKYLEGNNFTVFTDHANINTVLRSKSETLYLRQVDRFHVLLMPYLASMEIKHRPGRLHHNVDALSRLSGIETETSLL